MINLKDQTSEAERYLDNSEKLEVTCLPLKEQMRLPQLEVNNGVEKLLQMEGAVEGYKLKI